MEKYVFSYLKKGFHKISRNFDASTWSGHFRAKGRCTGSDGATRYEHTILLGARGKEVLTRGTDY